MSWVFLSDSSPVALKPYRCVLCSQPIERGLRHVARRGIDDDGYVTVRMHIECCDVTVDWKDDDWEFNCGDLERPCIADDNLPTGNGLTNPVELVEPE